MKILQYLFLMIPFFALIYIIGVIGSIEHGENLNAFYKCVPALIILCGYGLLFKKIDE